MLHSTMIEWLRWRRVVVVCSSMPCPRWSEWRRKHLLRYFVPAENSIMPSRGYLSIVELLTYALLIIQGCVAPMNVLLLTPVSSVPDNFTFPYSDISLLVTSQLEESPKVQDFSTLCTLTVFQLWHQSPLMLNLCGFPTS